MLLPRDISQGLKEILESVGVNLFVGGGTCVTSNTVIGDNVCLNGMNITGLGSVKIGNYVHSGIECLILIVSINIFYF